MLGPTIPAEHMGRVMTAWMAHVDVSELSLQRNCAGEVRNKKSYVVFVRFHNNCCLKHSFRRSLSKSVLQIHNSANRLLR